jgi:hypothetical protein
MQALRRKSAVQIPAPADQFAKKEASLNLQPVAASCTEGDQATS